MDGIIGHLDWRDCEKCKHYRPDEGGCQPLDKNTVDLEMDNYGCEDIICSEFVAKK